MEQNFFKLPIVYTTIEGWFDNANIFSKIISQFFNTNKEITIVEIGVWKGRSTVFIQELLTLNGIKSKHYCIDTFKGSIEEQHIKEIKSNINIFKLFKNNIKKWSKNVSIIKDYSRNAATKFKNNQIDFLYIDGSHQYEDVKQDLELFYDKVKTNGFVVVHDMQISDVKRAFNEFVESKKEFPLIYKNTAVFIKK